MIVDTRSAPPFTRLGCAWPRSSLMQHLNLDIHSQYTTVIPSTRYIFFQDFLEHGSWGANCSVIWEGELGRSTVDRALRSPVTSHCPINIPLSQLPSSPYMRRAAVPVIQGHAQHSSAFAQPTICSNEGANRDQTHLHFSFSPLRFRSRISTPLIGSADSIQARQTACDDDTVYYSRPCQLIVLQAPVVR